MTALLQTRAAPPRSQASQGPAFCWWALRDVRCYRSALSLLFICFLKPRVTHHFELDFPSPARRGRATMSRQRLPGIELSTTQRDTSPERSGGICSAPKRNPRRPEIPQNPCELIFSFLIRAHKRRPKHTRRRATGRSAPRDLTPTTRRREPRQPDTRAAPS